MNLRFSLPLATMVACLVATNVQGAVVTNRISDLPTSTSPSTNTWIEIADMNQVIKSRKYLLTNLATVTQVNAKASVNPTSGYLPYNNAGTFVDSPLYTVNSTNIGTDNKLYLGTNFNFYGQSSQVNFYKGTDWLGYLDANKLYLSSTNGAGYYGNNSASVHVVGLSNQVLGAVGFQLFGDNATASITERESPDLELSASAWDTDDAVARQVNFRQRVVSTSGVTVSGSFGILGPNANTNVFSVSANSGYDGSGTHFLSDDGTYKTVTSGGINPTWGYLLMNSNNVAVDSIIRQTNNTVYIEGGGTSIVAPGTSSGSALGESTNAWETAYVVTNSVGKLNATNQVNLTGGFLSSANSTNNAQMYIDQLITPSVRLRRYVLTHAGTVTLDMSTNTVQKLVLTGAVTFAFSNTETNRTYDLIIANSQATNCNITWPTNCVFFGYQPTYISALKHGWFQGQVGPQTNWMVHSVYSEQQ